LNDLRGGAITPVLTALSQRHNLRRLDMKFCKLGASNFKALVEAAWPALTYLGAATAEVAFDGPHALGAAAFAGFPVLEKLALPFVALGETGARLMASRSWARRLTHLHLNGAQLGGAGVTALAAGAWPALEWLDLRNNGPGAALTLEDARRWAPALRHQYRCPALD